jgi:transcriptional regulator with XRE-family HTH domain
LAIPWNEDDPRDATLILQNLTNLLRQIARRARLRQLPTVVMAQDWHRRIYKGARLPVPYYCCRCRQEARLVGTTREGLARTLPPDRGRRCRHQGRKIMVKVGSCIADRARWSQLELARKAGIASGTVSDYERGKISPGVAALQRLLSAMEYRMSDIETVSECIERLRKVLPVPDSEGLAKQVQLSTGSRIASGLSGDIDGGFEAVFVLLARLQREVLLVMNSSQVSEKPTET